jgi:hypothetical protein
MGATIWHVVGWQVCITGRFGDNAVALRRLASHQISLIAMACLAYCLFFDRLCFF